MNLYILYGGLHGAIYVEIILASNEDELKAIMADKGLDFNAFDIGQIVDASKAQYVGSIEE